METNKYIKVIVFGNSGTGKTIFGAGFPKKLHVCDFDLKINSAAAFFKNKPEMLEGITVEQYPYEAKAYGRAGKAFNEDMGKLRTLAAKGEFPYETLMLDSFTTMSERCMEHIIKDNPNVKRMVTNGVQQPSQQDYGLLLTWMKQFISELASFPCNLIMTAHIETKVDKITGATLRLPMASGKMASLLPIYFEEVYMSYVEGEGDKRKYLAQTQANRKFDCRSQRGLPPVIDLDYKSLVK